jgi:CspA family cold shock protein
MDNQDNSVSIEKRQVGIVKWFSNKLGYGFITYTDENNVSHDVFVHHTSIKPRRTSYRTLTMGEYVEFSLAELKNNNQKQAIDITGPANGPLLSDSVNEFRTNYRNTRPQYNNTRYNQRPTYNQHQHQHQEQDQDQNQEREQNSLPEVSSPNEIRESEPEKEKKSGMVPIKKSSIIGGTGSGWSNVVRKARQQDNKKIVQKN